MHVVDCMDVYFQLAYNELFWKTMCWCRFFIKLYQTSLGLNWCLQLIFCQNELLLFSKEKEFIPFPLRRVFDNLSWNSKILCQFQLDCDDISFHVINYCWELMTFHVIRSIPLGIKYQQITYLLTWVNEFIEQKGGINVIFSYYRYTQFFFSEINDNKDLYRHAVKICCQVNIRKLNINIILMWYLMQKWNIKF